MGKLIIDTDSLDILYCPKHDADYTWKGEFTEKKCNTDDCEFCKGRPKNITRGYCVGCPIKKECISFNARELGRVNDNGK